MSTHASEELLQALSNANLRLRQLQLLPSCSGDVQLAAESVSLELEKALSLVARADSRPAPPAARTASPPAPVACVPPLVPPPSAPAEPPRAPDTPKAPPLPLATAVRAATAPAGNDDGIPPWLANKNRQKHGGGPSPAQLAPQEFPSLASGGAASSAAAPGAWGRGRPAALAAPPRAPSDPQSGQPSAAMPLPRGLSPGAASFEAPRRLGGDFAGAVSKPRSAAEEARLKQVLRNAAFTSFENVKGRQVNVMAGLELHKGVLSPKEQERLLDFIMEQLARGRGDQLPGRTFLAPRKWIKGKGRITIQYGVCYSYANPPGITEDVVEALPKTLEAVVDRMVRWGVLPASVRPDSCIINIYEEADCIPPHIDHHDFTRPFCTMSLLSEAPMVFGARLDVVGEGEFAGSFSLALPVGSVCVIKGNSADVAKHAIPSVPHKRVSITFRKTSDGKRSLARTVPFRGHERDVLEC